MRVSLSVIYYIPLSPILKVSRLINSRHQFATLQFRFPFSPGGYFKIRTNKLQIIESSLEAFHCSEPFFLIELNNFVGVIR